MYVSVITTINATILGEVSLKQRKMRKNYGEWELALQLPVVVPSQSLNCVFIPA